MDPTALAPEFTYDPFSPDAMRSPESFYPTLREHHPAYYLPDYDAYAISRYADVWQAFMDSTNFSEAEGQVFSRDQLLVHHRGDPPPPKLDPKSLFLFLDPPVHNRFRRALATPFLKGNVGKMAADITQMVRGRLAELLERGTFDLNADLGSFVSVGATSLIMGLPLADTTRVVDLVNRMVARAPGRSGATPDGLSARADLIDLLKHAIARRRAGETEYSPVIDPLMSPDLIGRPQSDDEIAGDMLGILVGGTETVPKVFSGGLLELSRHPDQLAAVKADPAANVTPLFEEMLRFNAPAQWFGRTAINPVEVAGVTVERGQRVILLIAAANRDPREFEDADSFVWNRKVRRMLSFGVGPHFCIGIHLARLEGQIMLREFLSAVDAFTVLPDQGHWATSEFQIGWTSLPVRIDRLAAARHTFEGSQRHG